MAAVSEDGMSDLWDFLNSTLGMVITSLIMVWLLFGRTRGAR